MRKIVDKSMLGQAWFAPEFNPRKELVDSVLETRGITDKEKFLSPSVRDFMPDPSTMRDMDKAAKILTDAVLSNKKIAIFGDYDVDGITSVAIMVKYLRALGTEPLWYLPSREGDGYGLNEKAIGELAQKGAQVLVSVDCGISATPEVLYAKELGLDIVITDHHGVDGEIPNADAVVNPKRPDDTSGLSYLAGVGVAFMLLVAVNRNLKNNSTHKFELPNLLDYLDLVALGTICDMMPLIDLNRAFAATGIKVLGQRNNLGLRVLTDSAGIKKVSAYTISFALGPRLNAAGRMGAATPALDLLLTDNILVAQDLAKKLNELNSKRMDVQNAIMLDAIELANKCTDKCSLWISGEAWHNGVMGIVAGRLKDKYNMPVCVATKCGDTIDGSGRSISGVDLGKIIHEALGLGILLKGGGHAAAAGFTLARDKEADFCAFLEKSVSAQLGDTVRTQEVIADVEMDASGANLALAKEIGKMAPFGQNNPEPYLVLNGATLAYANTMKGGQHLRASVRTSAGTSLEVVGFNLAGTKVGEFMLDETNTGTKIKLLGRLTENEFNGRVTAQFMLEDIAV